VRTERYLNEANLDDRARVWLEAVRSQVPSRPHLRPDPGRAALLVVDMLRYFADPAGRCYLPAAAAVIPRIATLLHAFRDAGHPVVFTRHGHRGPGDLGMLGKFFSDYIREDEPDSSIVSALEPTPDEPVLRKTTYDAFLGTPLEETLYERGIEQVIISGVLTHMCCETTARAAFCRGFEVYVPVDAVASSSEERHLGSLMSMADAVAVVTSTAEVLELWPHTT
jgi:nicotinamidase-related amidase